MFTPDEIPTTFLDPKLSGKLSGKYGFPFNNSSPAVGGAVPSAAPMGPGAVQPTSRDNLQEALLGLLQPKPVEPPRKDAPWETGLKALMAFVLAKQGGMPAIAGMGAGLVHERERRRAEDMAQQKLQSEAALRQIQAVQAIRQIQRDDDLARQNKIKIDSDMEEAAGSFLMSMATNWKNIRKMPPEIQQQIFSATRRMGARFAAQGRPDLAENIMSSMETVQESIDEDRGMARQDAIEAYQKAHGNNPWDERTGKLKVDPKLDAQTFYGKGPDGDSYAFKGSELRQFMAEQTNVKPREPQLVKWTDKDGVEHSMWAYPGQAVPDSYKAPVISVQTAQTNPFTGEQGFFKITRYSDGRVVIENMGPPGAFRPPNPGGNGGTGAKPSLFGPQMSTSPGELYEQPFSPSTWLSPRPKVGFGENESANWTGSFGSFMKDQPARREAAAVLQRAMGR